MDEDAKVSDQIRLLDRVATGHRISKGNLCDSAAVEVGRAGGGEGDKFGFVRVSAEAVAMEPSGDFIEA